MSASASKTSTLRNLAGILVYLEAYPARVALAVGLLLLIIAAELLLPQVLGRAISALRSHLADGAPFQPFYFAGIYLGIAVIRETLRFLLGPIRNQAIQNALADIRADVYNSIQWLPFSFHDRSNTGDLISRSTSDITRLQEFFFACLFLSLDISLSIIVAVALTFLASPLLGWTLVAVLIPVIALIAYYARVLHPRWLAVHDRHSEMNTVIQENIAGVRVVKAFASEEREVAKFRVRKQAFYEAMVGTVNYWASRVPFAQFIFGLSFPLILWLGGRQVIAGTLPIGELTTIIFYLLAIGNRVNTIGNFTNIMHNASASAERILAITRQTPAIVSGSHPLPGGGGAVRFENVSFAYKEGHPSLTNFSLGVKPGQTVAFVGATGAGKTTVINLVPRFYDPTSGRVLVDGVDVRDLHLVALRRSVAVIFQETFLFSGSVAENIAFGRPEARMEEIISAAKSAQAHEFIEHLENGYETKVGERGTSLSGGQKQRIAIARAFLMNPRILILDDATAAVDPETERLIREAMRELTRGRTTFIIAHRFSTVRHAHLIVVLDHGEIVEQGTHAELVERRGAYTELFSAQLETEKNHGGG